MRSIRIRKLRWRDRRVTSWCSRYGFKRLPVRDPYQAPIGSVLVYGSGRAAGHVEIRTARGFVSDFRAATPSRRPLIGVYAKTSS